MMRYARLAAITALLVVLSGCEQQGPAERAGEKLDESIEEIQEQGKDLGNAVEDACEDLKKQAGAEDEDC